MLLNPKEALLEASSSVKGHNWEDYRAKHSSPEVNEAVRSVCYQTLETVH